VAWPARHQPVAGGAHHRELLRSHVQHQPAPAKWLNKFAAGQSRRPTAELPTAASAKLPSSRDELVEPMTTASITLTLPAAARLLAISETLARQMAREDREGVLDSQLRARRGTVQETSASVSTGCLALLVRDQHQVDKPHRRQADSRGQRLRVRAATRNEKHQTAQTTPSTLASRRGQVSRSFAAHRDPMAPVKPPQPLSAGRTGDAHDLARPARPSWLCRGTRKGRP
jgi:hypothetical protein